MAHGTPDWVRMVQVVVTVENEPVVVDEVTGTPIVSVSRYSGTSTTYQTVAGWTVTAGKVGRLREVSLKSDNYAKTVWQLEISGTAVFTGVTIGGALTLPFDDVALGEGESVTLSAKSSDGTSITADGSVTGKEVA